MPQSGSSSRWITNVGTLMLARTPVTSMAIIISTRRRAVLGVAAWRSNRPRNRRPAAVAPIDSASTVKTVPVPQVRSSHGMFTRSGCRYQGWRAHVPCRIRRSTRSGCAAASSTAKDPPSDDPSTVARSMPAASITARTSSARCSSGGASPGPTRSDRPLPRLSRTVTRLNEPSRRRNRATAGCSHCTSTFVVKPAMSTRSGPSPNTWYAMDTPSFTT